MKRFVWATLVLWAVTHPLTCTARAAELEERQLLQWRSLAELPDRLGVAGAFAGISNGSLIVAGGANFPEPLFKDGGRNPDAVKVWHNQVYVLETPDGQWKTASPLAHPLGYGASVTTEDGVICIGGSDSQRHYADVFMLRWVDGRIERTELAALPQPRANMAAALLGKTVYVAGGQAESGSAVAMESVLALCLDEVNGQWREIEPLPGPGRILPVAAAQDGSFFVFSGCSLSLDDAGSVKRTYLNDGYRFAPGQDGPFSGHWSRTADMPEAVTGAPSPAPSMGQTHVLILGGDNGRYAERTMELMDAHPGFSHDIWAYHTITDTWTRVGTMPAGHVTATAVDWAGTIVVPSGEIRPGTRSPVVPAGQVEDLRTGFSRLDYATWGAYLVGILCIGFYFARREKSTSDFFLGGRRIPWWAAGISVFGTQLSAITFMAAPAKVYATNWVYLLAQLGIVAVAPIIVFFYLPFFRKQNVTTAYEYLEHRFGVLMRLFGAAAFCLMQLGRMAIVLFLPALALSTAAGLNVYVCILLMGILCTVYTTLGGIEAVIWTDVIQVVVLIGGAIICIAVIVSGIGGGVREIIEVGAAADKFRLAEFTWDYRVAGIWVVLVGNVLSNLVPYSADQTVVQRYLTTPTQKQAAKAVWTNAVMTLPSGLLFFFLGTALYVFYKSQPAHLNPTLDTDAILPWFVAHELPTGIAGIILAAVFAASMSSLDSSLNSMATVLVTDFHQRLRPDAGDLQRLRLARVITVTLGLFATACALLMATFPIKSLWDVFMALIGLVGGPLAGVFALGMFTRRANSIGAAVGIVVSTITLYMVQHYTSAHFFLYGAVGIITCFVTGYVVSIVVGGPRRLTSS